MMVKTKEKVQTKIPISITSSDVNIIAENHPVNELCLSPSVTEFLDKYPFLISILEVAPGKIMKYFPDAEIDYEVTTDPEVENWVTLEIIIFTHLSANEAFENMKKLKKDWWLQAFVESDRKLRLDVVFI
ncbi:hypothetical protein KKB18_02975 [bacterium]|nr:hypothetical protein [bacterium]